MKRIDDKLPTELKVKVWIANNFKQILIFSMAVVILSLLLSLFAVVRSARIVEKNFQIIQNLSNKVIFVRADGKVAILEKEPISEQVLKYVLRELVIHKIILSASEVLGSGVTKFEDFDKIEKVKLLLENYFEKDSQGYKDYLAYLDFIWRQYVADNLPEYVQTPSLTGMEERIITQGESFSYEVSVPVEYVYAYAMNWRQGKGVIKVRLTGKVNLAYGSPENPFGIKIERLEVRQYVQKKER